MDHPSTLLPSPIPWPGFAAGLRRVVAVARRLKIAYAEHRRAARERAEFARLDDASCATSA